ncbi:hypothetical protein I7I53_05150 [Histoplasma capsulatum var. duboisii H88]|uniref:Uncharacterized protein n=1 Tax=Ajellomyces capsulatus (strain H88) TaxID=544711 RepID=A0A8A1LXE5_AJEC8|nr:hypothetical protein I7I53_05150 [Histoplasma capsulatum var. duboisii H88]
MQIRSNPKRNVFDINYLRLTLLCRSSFLQRRVLERSSIYEHFVGSPVTMPATESGESPSNSDTKKMVLYRISLYESLVFLHIKTGWKY